MSFDALPSQRRRIAIVGGGISGLAAAWLLGPRHDVTLFEASARLGGHARTVTAGICGDQPVDTGFIVFNYVNYPHLTRMFNALDVPVVRSDMSFGATIQNGAVEYGLKDMGALFGQRRNLGRPAFFGMVRDILRFNARAESVARDDSTTIGEMVQELSLGDWFQRYYLMPICGAIWSTPRRDPRIPGTLFGAVLSQPRAAVGLGSASMVDGQRRQPRICPSPDPTSAKDRRGSARSLPGAICRAHGGWRHPAPIRGACGGF